MLAKRPLISGVSYYDADSPVNASIFASTVQFAFPTNLNLEIENSEGFYPEFLRRWTQKLKNLLAVIQGFSNFFLKNRGLELGVLEKVPHISVAPENVTSLNVRIGSFCGCATRGPHEVKDILT